MTSRILLPFVLASACSGDPAVPAPDPTGGPPLATAPSQSNVLLVTFDTTRQDRLGAYGFGLARTPNIDRLAVQGARFDDHATVAPITLPAHISIMTGLNPPAHGVRDNGAYALADAVPTLAEQLGDRGWDTAAFVSAAVLDRRYNLDQGFDLYDDELWDQDKPALFFIRDRPARSTADRTLAWLEARAVIADPAPFFAWVHFFDPHQPYEVDTQAAGDVFLMPSPYDAEIAAADHALGRIIDWLDDKGQLDDTVVVMTADHGESLGDHGERTHAVFVYDATMKVPLIIRYPGQVPAGRVVTTGTSAIDVAPTVLGLLGQDPLDNAQGRDLSGALRSGEPVAAHPQYIESLLSERGFGMAPLQGVRDGGMKWIRAPRSERYDLRVDPGEKNNLHADDPGPSAALDATLTAILDDSAKRAVASVTNPLDGETQEMLLAMGYLAPVADRDAVAGMDPKDGMPLHQLMEEGRHALRRGNFEVADKKLLAVLAELPGNVSVWNVLGLSRVRQQRLDEAREAYARSLALDPRQHRVLGMLGSLHLMAGELDAARPLLLQALEVTPGFVEAMISLAKLEFEAGDTAAAEEWAQKAHAADPAFPRGWGAMADLRFRQKRWDEARKWYEKVLADTPSHFIALIQAGLSAHRGGDTAGALAHLNAASELRDDTWVAPYNLACVHATSGAVAPAMVALKEAAGRGLDLRGLVAKDVELNALRGHPDFAAVVAQVDANADKSAAASRMTGR